MMVQSWEYKMAERLDSMMELSWGILKGHRWENDLDTALVSSMAQQTVSHSARRLVRRWDWWMGTLWGTCSEKMTALLLAYSTVMKLARQWEASDLFDISIHLQWYSRHCTTFQYPYSTLTVAAQTWRHSYTLCPGQVRLISTAAPRVSPVWSCLEPKNIHLQQQYRSNQPKVHQSLLTTFSCYMPTHISYLSHIEEVYRTPTNRRGQDSYPWQQSTTYRLLQTSHIQLGSHIRSLRHMVM